MIKIESIEIHGFKSSSRVAKAILSDENVSVIYGPNGCGKTSFLKILHGVLAQEESALIQNSVNKVSLSINFDGEKSKLSIFKNDDGDYVWDEVLRSV